MDAVAQCIDYAAKFGVKAALAPTEVLDGGLTFLASGRRVGFDGGRLEQYPFPVRLLHGLENSLPDSGQR